MTYSYTQISQYLSCPRRYKHRDLKADMTIDGKKIYQVPVLNYEQAFGEVCKVIDEHPEFDTRAGSLRPSLAINQANCRTG